MSMYLSQIIEQALAHDALINGLAIDSRKVLPGDAFFAYQGEQADGHDYIQQAVNNGAAAVVVEKIEQIESLTVATAQVANLRDKLSQMAANFYQHPSKLLAIAAITGTNGKTSISHYIAQLYQALNKPCAVIGTLGSFYGDKAVSNVNTTPDAISLQQQLADIAKAGIHFVAMESSSHALQQKRQAAVDIDVAVFSNLTAEHLDYHGDMQHYFEAKQQLFAMPSVRFAVLNKDDAWFEQLKKSLPAQQQVLDYSLKDSQAFMSLAELNQSENAYQGKLLIEGQFYPFTLPLLGEFNLANAMAASCVLLARGESVRDVIAAWAKLKAAPGRMQTVANSKGIYAVVDYAHTADALENVLANLRQLSRGKLIVVFGCGGDRDKQKRPAMAKVAEKHADFCVITDDNPRNENAEQIRQEIISGFTADKFADIGDRQAAIEKAVALAENGDVLLVAGKGHEQVQIIAGVEHVFSDSDVLSQALSNKEGLC